MEAEVKKVNLGILIFSQSTFTSALILPSNGQRLICTMVTFKHQNLHLQKKIQNIHEESRYLLINKFNLERGNELELFCYELIYEN